MAVVKSTFNLVHTILSVQSMEEFLDNEIFEIQIFELRASRDIMYCTTIDRSSTTSPSSTCAAEVRSGGRPFSLLPASKSTLDNIKQVRLAHSDTKWSDQS